MNYVHPSTLTLEHGAYYVVFSPAPSVAVWRNNMGQWLDGKAAGAFCTKTVRARSTQFDVIEGVYLCAKLEIPTEEQCVAADQAIQAMKS